MASSRDGGNGETALVVGRVIGDVLDPFTTCVSMRVVFGNRDISNGWELRPSHVVNRPRVSVGGNDLRTFYTLIMVDSDAPSPVNPVLREYLHWMVTDIPSTTDATFGNEGVFYESPQPSAGIHRFALVLFRQLGRETVFAPEWRHNFNVTPENSLRLIILDLLLLLFTSIVSENVVAGEGGGIIIYSS